MQETIIDNYAWKTGVNTDFPRTSRTYSHPMYHRLFKCVGKGNIRSGFFFYISMDTTPLMHPSELYIVKTLDVFQ